VQGRWVFEPACVIYYPHPDWDEGLIIGALRTVGVALTALLLHLKGLGIFAPYLRD